MRVSHKKFILFLIAILVLGYGIFQARFYLYGPRLQIDSPADGALVNENLLVIRGKALETSRLLLNGRAIFTDAAGNFSEELLLAHGLNRITLEAEDKFGKRASASRMIVLK